jgi:RND family efflux transporter MFP subunit
MTLEPLSVDEQTDEANAAGRAGSRLEALRDRPHAARSHLRWILPLAAIALGAGIHWLFVATREMPDAEEPVVPTPLVRIQTVAPEDVRFSVTSRGVVAPRTESDLVAEVRGRVLWLSPDLVVGGFFEEGDELLRLDDREYRIARDRAEAAVRLRESEARLATADAERRRRLSAEGAASAADLEQFESRELVAKALLAEAEASLAQAELDLERTRVRAPFDGRVRERHVDVGQFVSPGTRLGRIFAVDYAEVRLPIQIDELAYLDASLVGLDQGRADAEGPARPDVLLRGRLGGREWTWDARLVRAEASIDEQTRMLNVVARVDDPYLRHPADAGVDSGVDRTPLPVGLFVHAEIEGREAEDVFVVPPLALRDDDRVFVLDDTDRLRVRPVEVVRRDPDRVVIGRGLAAGDRVVVSPLRIYADGMALRAVEAEPAVEALPSVPETRPAARGDTP